MPQRVCTLCEQTGGKALVTANRPLLVAVVAPVAAASVHTDITEGAAALEFSFSNRTASDDLPEAAKLAASEQQASLDDLLLTHGEEKARLHQVKRGHIA